MARVNKVGMAAQLALISAFMIIKFAGGSAEINRKLQSHFNYKCPPGMCDTAVNGGYINLLYTRADGPSDSLHYIISSVGVPSLLIANTSLDSKLNIDWTKLLSDDTGNVSDSITFTEKPSYTYAVIVQKLLEYNDTNDKADVTLAEYNTSTWYDMKKFVWENSSAISDISAHQIRFNTSSYIGGEGVKFTNNGSISLSFQVFGSQGRSKVLPHLMETTNTTQFDLTIDHKVIKYSASRFAIQVAMVTVKENDTKVTTKEEATIDDEHTPGVFELWTWYTQGVGQRKGAYMQWKPVCYTSLPRSMEHATKVKYYTTDPVNMTHPERSVVLGYYGNDLHTKENLVIYASNFSFGLSEDKFYTNSNFTTWSATIGSGAPPQDAVSVTIIMIIIACLGVPLVVYIVLSGYFHKKFLPLYGRGGKIRSI